jgi:hypothetical protein
MITFILIFFVMVITASISAVVLFSIYLKRKNKSLADAETNQKQFDNAPPYRSLFAPDETELRAAEREAQMRVEAERKEAEEKSAFEKIQAAQEFQRAWRDEPNRQNTVKLLRLASETEDAEIFSQTAQNMIKNWNHEQAGGLSKTDLADLLDSHLRTLPQQERFSGAIFWLKQEIENLRGKSESKS